MKIKGMGDPRSSIPRPREHRARTGHPTVREFRSEIETRHRKRSQSKRVGHPSILEQVRRKHKFEVVGYVVMPEHFHILIGEPEKGNPLTVLQVLKQSVAKRLLKPARKRRRNQPMLWQENELPGRRERHFWQPRFYDFNVYSNEKLRYMHANPVKRGLVSAPELWAWSSCRAYMCGAPSVVKIDELEAIRQKKEQLRSD